MASAYRLVALLVLLSAIDSFSSTALGKQPFSPSSISLNMSLSVIKDNISLNIVWYGKFTAIQRSIIVDFIRSLNSPTAAKGPSVASWWNTTEKYKGGASTIVVGKQLLLEDYPLGKSLKSAHLRALSAKLNGGGVGSINAVLTAKDVTVEGFCKNRCGSKSSSVDGGAYVWVGNSEEQCPGYCAWPFHQPLNGPQSPPLIAPNGDVGVDGMIINLATLLVNTATNTSKSGYINGDHEPATYCDNRFGSDAYPGYAGQVLVDKTTGASYNALGLAGRKYLLPAIWNPCNL